MTAQEKPTIEEAVLSQSLADIHRAEGKTAQADGMDAAALEVLDPMAPKVRARHRINQLRCDANFT